MIGFEERWTLAESNRIHVRQGKVELRAAYNLLAQEGPYHNLLEIGSFRGGSALIYSGLLERGCKIILIDDCSRGKEVVADLHEVMDLLTGEGFVVNLVQGLSEDGAVREMVQEVLDDERVGLCHIDGCHLTPAVLADWRAYALPYISAAGYCILHDVVAPGGVHGAWKRILADVAKDERWQAQVLGGEFWKDMKPDKKSPEFWATGIGLLRRII